MWIVAVSICSALTLVIVLALCSCWKRQEQKDDWLGLDGMVKQKNPDENVNHIPLPQPPATNATTNANAAAAASLQIAPELCTTNVSTDAVLDQTTVDASKRPAVQTSNTRRSLPDIPSEGHALQVRERWDAQGDNSSELYATVEPYTNGGKRHTLPNGLDSRPSISQHSSISQADDVNSPYASVNYDKLHQFEHPYAIVKAPTTVGNEEINTEPTVRTSLLSAEQSTSNEPHAPPRSRRTSEQSIHIDINAASAVAGGIAANQDLPYMTPPINPHPTNQQINFSGDSQDSSKGYTSISVREPLANIIAQTKDMNKVLNKRALDPHYSTVSDDSDEMYTTIPDALNQEYTSGSETYAQIQPVALTVAADIYPVPSNLQPTTTESTTAILSNDESAPQPPSVDILKNMTNSHSRQDGELFAASSTSSILNLGSPKPEKRQANSPLPPPPSTTTSTSMSTTQLTLSPDNTRRNLDDMYAKVQKNRKKSSDDVTNSNTNQNLNSNPNRKSTSSTSSSEDKRDDVAHAQATKQMPCQQQQQKMLREHNYETLKKSPKKASVSLNSDGYEELKTKNPEPGYASINGPDSLGYDDPNYEQLKDKSTPRYSTINEVNANSNHNSSLDDLNNDLGYSVINKNINKNKVDEPTYESMPASEVDPNYESVQHNDPNYESVKYLDVDIGYERLQQIDDDTDSGTTTTTTNKTDNKNGYETVDSAPYEKLKDDDGKTDSESSGYERIDKSSSIDDKSRSNDDYETIKSDLNDCLGDENAIFEV